MKSKKGRILIAVLCVVVLVVCVMYFVTKKDKAQETEDNVIVVALSQQ